jgi:hypothetical protein
MLKTWATREENKQIYPIVEKDSSFSLTAISTSLFGIIRLLIVLCTLPTLISKYYYFSHLQMKKLRLSKIKLTKVTEPASDGART